MLVFFTRKCVGPLAVLVALGGWRPAVAMSSIEADLDKLMPLSLMELINIPVVTASRQSETRDQTPSHIVVVTREQIRERRYKNLADLLEDMPGVDFMRGTKSSAYNNFAVQGYAGPNKLVVMMDGVRINQPAGGSFPIAENLALYQAKQVEFLYGPAAALYGADAVAGVINIITDNASERQGSWASVGAGNFGTREASFMTGYKGDGPVALSVGGHWQYSDRAPLQDYYPRDFAKVNAGSIPASAREDYVGDIKSSSLYARADIGKDLTIGFFRSVFRSLTSTGDTPATALYLDDSRWQTTTDTLYGKFRFELSPNLSGELVLDYSNMEVDPQAKYVNFYSGFTPGYSYERGQRYGIEQNLNWRVNDAHRVQAGFGYQKYYAIEAGGLPGPYSRSAGPDGQGYNYPNTNLPVTVYEDSFYNLSAYAQVHSEWNSQWSTMAGLRLDHHSSYGNSLNPRLGAVWRANDQHLFKVLYGQAFRAPAPEESRSSFGTFDGSKDGNGLYIGRGFRIANLDLKPEKAKTLSLTWDWRPRQDVNLVTNLYHSRIENLVVTLPSSDIHAIPGAVLVSPESKGNAGRQVQTGIDLMAQWRFKLGPGWTGDLWSSASWVTGKIDEGDGVDWDLPYIASYKLKLGTTLRYADKLSITPQVLKIGDTTNGRKNNANNPPDRMTTPGYTLTNLHVGWHRFADSKATLWFDVYNLFDKRYYVAHGSASRTFFDMPQQPRSWVASIEYPF